MASPLVFYKDPKRKSRELFKVVIILTLCVLTWFLLPSTFVYLFFGFLFLVGSYLLFSLLRNKPTVIINQDGIKNNTNAMGIVSWQLIKGFEIKKGINFVALVIMLQDQEAFFKDKNSLVKGLMKSNIQRFGSPVVIAETEFNVSLPEVIQMIETYRNQ
ncbi:STM3941 family protein [Kordia algicida OT-1]|uniref:Uncharacterized protein n=1 Tax=Kordia algicida OT-1 TaxID=391587 RepID=A9EDP3_9FLAO|nr:STM3941 family protein [Kordia algicida]EDP94204.1 hypothetical protein KAOT1_00900 [Kordia algicida OT-1]